MGWLGLLEGLIILGLLFYAFRGFIKRRWPNFGRKIQIVLVLSLIAVTAFRVFIWLQR